MDVIAQEGLCMLTDQSWENLINSRLEKFGMHVQASHERSGGYICYGRYHNEKLHP